MRAKEIYIGYIGCDFVQKVKIFFVLFFVSVFAS